MACIKCGGGRFLALTFYDFPYLLSMIHCKGHIVHLYFADLPFFQGHSNFDHLQALQDNHNALLGVRNEP